MIVSIVGCVVHGLMMILVNRVKLGLMRKWLHWMLANSLLLILWLHRVKKKNYKIKISKQIHVLNAEKNIKTYAYTSNTNIIT